MVRSSRYLRIHLNLLAGRRRLVGVRRLAALGCSPLSSALDLFHSLLFVQLTYHYTINGFITVITTGKCFRS